MMNDDTISEEPPHSLEAERNLIADAIQRATGEHLATLTPDHFYFESHRHMVRAIQSVVAAGKLPTTTAVVEALHRSGARGPISEALADVLRLARGFKGIGQDAEIVRTKAEARRIALACADTQAAITLGRIAPSEAKAALDRALGTIEDPARDRLAVLDGAAIAAPLPDVEYLVREIGPERLARLKPGTDTRHAPSSARACPRLRARTRFPWARPRVGAPSMPPDRRLIAG